MKIGVDIRCLMESQYSGISEYTYNLLNHLFQIDKENQYFLFYNSSRPCNIPRFDYPNVDIRSFDYPNKIFNLSLRFLKIAQVDKMLGGVDVFLIPNFLFLNLSKKCKKILIVHDLSFELYPEFFTFKKRLWHRLIGPKKLCQESDAVIAISENTKNDLIRIYRLPEDKVKVIQPGISEKFFQNISDEEKNRVKNKYQLPKNYLLYLGNLEPRKNIRSLISAFEKISDPNIYLIIAGGVGWKHRQMYNLWQKSEHKDRIKFLGYVDNSDKPALYALAKIFIYPSIYEGFGLPPIEAMACSTPVITSFSSSLPEAINNAGLMVDPNNFNELAETINKTLLDENLILELKSRGLINSKKYNWPDKASKILEIINTIKK